MKHEAATPTPATPDYAPDNFVQFVTSRLGDDVMRQIERAFGGRRIYLTISPKDHHVLAKVIGVENAKLISIEFGHGMVEIPLGSANRHARIEQACLDGRTVTEVARSFGCCTRTVSKIRAKLRRQGLMP